MPVVWLSHCLGVKRVERVYGPDLMRVVSARSPARGYRHFYFGGTPGVADLGGGLSRRQPGIERGRHGVPAIPPSTPEEDAELIAQINAAAPDIVWVGLGTPKQEYWMASHIRHIHASVLIGVGAAFDFWAAPRNKHPSGCNESGLNGCFGCARNRVACGAATPKSFLNF